MADQSNQPSPMIMHLESSTAMTDAIDELREEIRDLARELGVLSKAFEVHIAGETEHRARQLEKLENVKLTIEISSLRQAADLRTSYDARLLASDARITEVSHRADAHIERCEEENEKLEAGRKIRLNHIYGLWASLVIMAIAMVKEFFMK